MAAEQLFFSDALSRRWDFLSCFGMIRQERPCSLLTWILVSSAPMVHLSHGRRGLQIDYEVSPGSLMPWRTPHLLLYFHIIVATPSSCPERKRSRFLSHNLFQAKRRKDPLLRKLSGNITTLLQSHSTNNRIDRLCQHNVNTRRLESVGLSGLPSHHFVESISSRQLRQSPLVQSGRFCVRRDVLQAGERGMCEYVDVLVRLVFGRERLLQQDERGLEV